MRVNICPRLIQKAITKGMSFVVDGEIHTHLIPLGLYATKHYKKDEVVHVMDGMLSNTPTQYSIHIGYDMHVVYNYDSKYGKYINPSSDPNIKVEFNKLVAIKDIHVNDEITLNDD